MIIIVQENNIVVHREHKKYSIKTNPTSMTLCALEPSAKQKAIKIKDRACAYYKLINHTTASDPRNFSPPMHRAVGTVNAEANTSR